MIVDFHSHILPGIDDGSSSLQESVELLKMEAQQGIKRVVATPHFYPRHDSPERFLNRRRRAEESLRDAIAEDPTIPSISVGAEVYFFPGISDSDVLHQLTIDQKRCILLEMPQCPWQDSMYREIEGIYVKQGLTPIIAHVDRYIAPFRTYGIPERLMDLPVLVQANASFFLNRATAGMAIRMLKKGQIHILGSDCHNLEHRPPRLGKACEVIEKRLGSSVFTQIESYGRQILVGNP